MNQNRQNVSAQKLVMPPVARLVLDLYSKTETFLLNYVL